MSINKQLKIGDLTAKLPIIQGGMGVGVSRSSLAQAHQASKGNCAGEWSCRCKYYGCAEALCGACERGSGSGSRCDHQWCRSSDEPAGAGQ